MKKSMNWVFVAIFVLFAALAGCFPGVTGKIDVRADSRDFAGALLASPSATASAPSVPCCPASPPTTAAGTISSGTGLSDDDLAKIGKVVKDNVPTPAPTASPTNTAEKYGLCISSTATNGSGVGTSGTGATPVKDAVYDGDGTCTTGGGTSVGQLSTTAGQVWSVTGPTVDAFANLLVFTTVTTTTEAHTDYADTLTFTVAATF